MLEQDARDTAATALRGDIEVADRPGGTEHQRRRHDRGRDEPARLPGVNGRGDHQLALSQLAVKPVVGELGGRWLAVVCPVIVEQGCYLAEHLVGWCHLHDCYGHGISLPDGHNPGRPPVSSRSQILIVRCQAIYLPHDPPTIHETRPKSLLPGPGNRPL